MTEADEEKGKVRDTHGDTSVLGNLPRTRPQRASPRRAAARRAMTMGAVEAAGAAPARPDTSRKKPAKARAAQGKTPPGRANAQRPGVEPVPKQGFEAESEFDSLSGPVKPPGGTELVVSVAEIAGELAKAGLSTGERLLKDALSRLTRSD